MGRRRTRVTQMEDHLRMGASRCRNFANSAATRKSAGPRMTRTESICGERAWSEVNAQPKI